MRPAVDHEPQHLLLTGRDLVQRRVHQAGHPGGIDRRLDLLDLAGVEEVPPGELRDQRPAPGLAAVDVPGQVRRDREHEGGGLGPSRVVSVGHVEEADEGLGDHVGHVLGAGATPGRERRHASHVAAVEGLEGLEIVR
jgi:hypothetical protein